MQNYVTSGLRIGGKTKSLHRGNGRGHNVAHGECVADAAHLHQEIAGSSRDLIYIELFIFYLLTVEINMTATILVYIISFAITLGKIILE